MSDNVNIVITGIGGSISTTGECQGIGFERMGENSSISVSLITFKNGTSLDLNQANTLSFEFLRVNFENGSINVNSLSLSFNYCHFLDYSFNVISQKLNVFGSTLKGIIISIKSASNINIIALETGVSLWAQSISVRSSHFSSSKKMELIFVGGLSGLFSSNELTGKLYAVFEINAINFNKVCFFISIILRLILLLLLLIVV